MAVHLIVVKIWHKKPKMSTSWCSARGNVRWSPKSAGLIFWGPWLSVQIAWKSTAEIFQWTKVVDRRATRIMNILYIIEWINKFSLVFITGLFSVDCITVNVRGSFRVAQCKLSCLTDDFFTRTHFNCARVHVTWTWEMKYLSSLCACLNY